MATNISPFDGFFEQWMSHPKATAVEKLLEIGTVESLTKFKFNLIDKGRQVSEFPKGDAYTRRKPRGRSSFATLEERLADDVFELLVCLDTGVIQPEVSAMFKPLAEESFCVNDETIHGNDNIANIEFGTPILNVSQGGIPGIESRLTHKRCADRFATIEASVFLFKEKMKEDITSILSMLAGKDKLIKTQGEEINELKTENLNFKCRVQSLENRLSGQVSRENTISNRNRELYSEKQILWRIVRELKRPLGISLMQIADFIRKNQRGTEALLITLTA